MEIAEGITLSVKLYRAPKVVLAQLHVKTRTDGIVCTLFRNSLRAMCFTDDPTPSKKRRTILLDADTNDALVALLLISDREVHAVAGRILLRCLEEGA